MRRTSKRTGKVSAPSKPPAVIRGRTASQGTKTRTLAARQMAAAAAQVPGEPAINGPRTLGELMSLALEMEMEAAQRYTDLADAMDTHNNRKVAALFRKLAEIENKHAAQIMAAMAWKQTPATASTKRPWEGFEAPETTSGDEVHYLMQPYHALQLALANEERAERFFARLARVAMVDSVRQAALEMQAEEREHVALIKAWLQKTPKPSPYWAEDPDPARYTD
jgi:rubrerythrin